MKSRKSAFTLIELLVTITIIGLLVTLMIPNLQRVNTKAMSVKCANNLRQIGVAVNLYAQDHDNRFPALESMPGDPVYADIDTGGAKPLPIYETLLQPYNMSKDLLKCPADVKTYNYFAKEGSSYQWRNIVDDESTSAPKVYGRRGTRNPRTGWLMLLSDYETVHNGHNNRLYADGHVQAN